MISFSDMKNLLRQSLQSQRNDEQQLVQLQEDLNRNDENSSNSQSNHRQSQNQHQVITLEGDNQFSVGQQQTYQHDSNSPMISSTAMRNQENQSHNQNNNDVSSSSSNPINIQTQQIAAAIVAAHIQQQQQQQAQQNQVHQEEQGNVDIIIEQNRSRRRETGLCLNFLRHTITQSVSQIFHPHHQHHEDHQVNETNISLLALLQSLTRGLTQVRDKLNLHVEVEYSLCLHELENGFWLNLSNKLKLYQKMAISSFLFNIVFFIITVYYSLKQFSFEMVGAKIILLYIVKNAIELYLSNKVMGNVLKRVDEYDRLKICLREFKENYRTHIDHLTNSTAAFDQLLQLQERIMNIQNNHFDFDDASEILSRGATEMDQMLKQNVRSLTSQIESLDRMTSDTEMRMKEIEIANLKVSLGKFKRLFHPLEEFELLPSKNAMIRVRQALIKDTPGMFFFSYVLKLYIFMLTVMNGMIVFTSQASNTSWEFLAVLWLNLIRDNIQPILITVIFVLFVVAFVFFFIFTRIRKVWLAYQHKKKIAQQMDSLKKIKFTEECEVKDCSICLNEYEKDEVITTLNCDNKHNFHQACILTWINMRNECPLCRAPIFS